ncbi:hypothetical protein B0186_02770 [Canicola haemoglobinophilus]|uniref:YbjN domain-containing protein n=1 Tax=Canicola haemoglobinophilus TaxID=733 RepID=A0A1V4B2Z6_9PAST|nr:YbjN domain-containing protein [Canicola haemoglobinophilus]OOS01637.1 hypothetical protein B0186_02770 [Canicola haemoglobinophilus]STO58904.1 Uncharacterised protein [Canicola haemoglobinophilus]
MNNWFDDEDNTEFVEVKKSYSDQELITLLRNEGYSPVKLLKKGGIVFQAEGTNYLIINQQDTLQIVVTFNDADHIDYEQLNEWNSEYRFTRAYINKDIGLVHLDNDLDLRAGVSEQQIIRFIAKFRMMLHAFKEKLG